MTCSNPIDSAVLADYWLDALPKSEEEAVEEHLFSCNECGARLREIIAPAAGVRTLARQGSLIMVVSDAFMKRIANQGRRVREYATPCFGSVECTVSADDDFLIGRLTEDLCGARRVDFSLCDHQGIEQVQETPVPDDEACEHWLARSA